MTHTYAFNGDADGLCALQQLRLAEPRAGVEVLVTGVKRDIALVGRVTATAGDACTVLDVSLDVNRAGLRALLDAGVAVRYFDHHFAGEIPAHPGLDAHIDLAPDVCTSLLVDRFLDGRCRGWAIVGAFGDSLIDEASSLAQAAGIAPEDARRLRALGVAINYNAYGETLADLHVSPVDLAAEMLPYTDPLDFAARSATFQRLDAGYRADMEAARRLEPARRAPGAILFVLPDAAWARRASGTLANDLAKAHADSAVAIVSPKAGQDNGDGGGGSGSGSGYLVSVRVPRESSLSAEAFCRQFPTGGGRRAAAGINHLPEGGLDAFSTAFEAQFRRSST